MLKESRNHTPRQKARARELRTNMSTSEKVLWQFLRKDRLGFHFRRQLAVGPYILDFYCAEARLCIEVDGEQHLTNKAWDAERDEDLLRRGILTLRIPSLDLFEHAGEGLGDWLDRILHLCYERTQTPAQARSQVSDLLS